MTMFGFIRDVMDAESENSMKLAMLIRGILLILSSGIRH